MSPISNSSQIKYITEQEQPKCSICHVDKVIRMIFDAIYGTSYQFCSDACIVKWMINKK